jgi:hypothetical protein
VFIVFAPVKTCVLPCSKNERASLRWEALVHLIWPAPV